MGILDDIEQREKELRITHDAIQGTIAEVSETSSDYREGARRLKVTYDDPQIRVAGVWTVPQTEDGSFSHWVTMGSPDGRTGKFRYNASFARFLQSAGKAFAFDPNVEIESVDNAAAALNDLLVGKRAMIEVTQEAITGKDGQPAVNRATGEPYAPRTISTMTALEAPPKKVKAARR